MSTTAAPPLPTGSPGSRTPAGRAGLIGLLSVGTAVGIGHLVAAFVSPPSSPFTAVADTVIRLSPERLTEFGKSLGPEVDKLALQAGVLAALVVVGVLAGLLSRRGARPGTALIAVVGLVGLAAVVFSPVFAPLDLIAPVLAVPVGTGTFLRLHRLAAPAPASAPVSAPAPDPDPAGSRAAEVSRRGVLVASTVAAGVATVGGFAAGQLLAGGSAESRGLVTAALGRARYAERAPAVPSGAGFPELGTPTFITANPDFYRIDTALRVPGQSAADWRMRIHGMVDREITLTVDDLLSRTLVERTITMTCVSNPIGGNLVSTSNFIGVELRDILLEAGVRPGADQLYSTSVDGWYTGTPTDVVMEPGRGALLAIGMNGEALPPEHGFPVRMVVPGLYGYVSATKWVVDLEATTFADPRKRGYWVERSWAQKAPIKTMSRIDSPRGFAQVPAGRLTASGIAWAQHRGIDKVELRTDGGPWQVAELSTEVGVDTWRMWRIDLDLPAGGHQVQVRATDRTGATQTQTRADPIPDGASGWPATFFTSV